MGYYVKLVDKQVVRLAEGEDRGETFTVLFRDYVGALEIITVFENHVIEGTMFRYPFSSSIKYEHGDCGRLPLNSQGESSPALMATTYAEAEANHDKMRNQAISINQFFADLRKQLDTHCGKGKALVQDIADISPLVQWSHGVAYKSLLIRFARSRTESISTPIVISSGSMHIPKFYKR